MCVEDLKFLLCPVGSPIHSAMLNTPPHELNSTFGSWKEEILEGGKT